MTSSALEPVPLRDALSLEDEMAVATSSETICSLPEDELRQRIAELRRDLRPLVQRTEPLADDTGVVAEFEPRPEIRRQLEDLVAFERPCCSGLDWNLEVRSDRLRLTIAGLSPDSKFFQTLGVAPEAVSADR